MATTNESLATLQAIFKEMGSNSDAVREGEMREQLMRLKKKEEIQDEEMKVLRPMKTENKTLKVKLMMREKELQSAKTENEQKSKELSKRNKLIKVLLEQRGGG